MIRYQGYGGSSKKKDDMENIYSFERYIVLQFNLKIKNDEIHTNI